jgi:hypothetical protein
VLVAVHRVAGLFVVGLFAIGWVWGLGAKLAKRGPGERFWWWLTAVQVSLGVQAILGISLYLTGHRVESTGLLGGTLHYVYGALPIVLLVYAHAVARAGNASLVGLDPARQIAPWVPFAWASFICFGLTLRALMTGLGVG